MKTLDAPVYEVKQDSEWYKDTIRREKQIEEFFKKINSEYFKDNGFSFYHSGWFGVQRNSADYETYKDEVLKNPDKNGIHIIKKRSKYYPIFKELLDPIENESPFRAHDVLGMNNISASQWIGDRWFFSVKHEKYVKGVEVVPVDYKDYLSLVMSTLK